MNSMSDSNEMANSVSTPEAGPPSTPPPPTPPRPGATSEETAPPPDRHAHFAVRSDGAILLNAADLKGFDLSGREVFVAIALTPAETRFVLRRLTNAAADTAARLIGSLVKGLSRLSS
jgi:hypothetical protein